MWQCDGHIEKSLVYNHNFSYLIKVFFRQNNTNLLTCLFIIYIYYSFLIFLITKPRASSEKKKLNKQEHFSHARTPPSTHARRV